MNDSPFPHGRVLIAMGSAAALYAATIYVTEGEAPPYSCPWTQVISA